MHSSVHVSDKASAGKTTIPTKATLARSASSKRKVPPIPLSERSHADKDDSQSHDSSHDSMLDDAYMDEEDRQVSDPDYSRRLLVRTFDGCCGTSEAFYSTDDCLCNVIL